MLKLARLRIMQPLRCHYQQEVVFVTTAHRRLLTRPLRKFHQSRVCCVENQKRERLADQVRRAWNSTETKWYPIPIGLGLAVIGFQHYLHVQKREREQREGKEGDEGGDRAVIVGPWQVHVASALPLRSISRLWGKLNELTLPVPLRAPLYRLYSWVFGCNLDEIEEEDLSKYPNLSAFFYRKLKPGARLIDEKAPLVSPADGRVLHFGIVEEQKIEQVKGFTYSLDAFLGKQRRGEVNLIEMSHAANVAKEQEFAVVNGISYTLDTMLGSETESEMEKKEKSDLMPDATAPEHKASLIEEFQTAAEVSLSPPTATTHHSTRAGNAVYFCVIYLAPGDYHRFHSPTNWVCESRRHFAGELFSVSPYMVSILKDLFVLNERVVLLGRWRYGFFSMIPVGATNVGSIKINFDQKLKTNQKEYLQGGTFEEASYRGASRLLGGKPLHMGDEVGGFCLGSTVVLVFEAPIGFKFTVEAGQKVRMGQALGSIEN
ncbi:uncharacterized protein VTP21DRAFT_5852 [Calcarisporiella thermophila]|uniref:uncharacterized protein n=1 Tax=Calcarisporiella thermophila TaxID=911321 RepID=UPI0037426BB8